MQVTFFHFPQFRNEHRQTVSLKTPDGNTKNPYAKVDGRVALNTFLFEMRGTR